MQEPSRRAAQLPIRPKSAHHHKMVREFTERSISQWALSSALAYTERWGVVICGFLFFFNENRDFWSFWGIVFVVAHLVILSPVYGILVFMNERTAYKARRWIGRPIIDQKALVWLGRAVHIFWLPLMWLCSHELFRIYDRLAPLKGPVDFWRMAFT